MKLTIILADPEASEAVEIDGRDRRAFERIGRKALGFPQAGSMKDAVAAAPESYMIWLAYHALAVRGQRKEFGDWNAFEARVVTAEAEDTEEDILGDPTSPAT